MWVAFSSILSLSSDRIMVLLTHSAMLMRSFRLDRTIQGWLIRLLRGMRAFGSFLKLKEGQQGRGERKERGVKGQENKRHET